MQQYNKVIPEYKIYSHSLYIYIYIYMCVCVCVVCVCVCVNVYTYIYNLVNFLQKVYYWINNKGLDAKKKKKL